MFILGGLYVKKILPLALLISPYLYLGYCARTGLDISTLYAYLVLVALVLVPNMIYAFVAPKLGFKSSQLLFWALVLKLCHIPIYVVIFSVAVLLHIFILPLLPLLVVFDYLLLLSTTMYGISGILVSRQTGQLSSGMAVWLAIGMFIFCIDIISTLCCYIILTNKKSTV